jgi:hypothetical protein
MGGRNPRFDVGKYFVVNCMNERGEVRGEEIMGRRKREAERWGEKEKGENDKPKSLE